MFFKIFLTVIFLLILGLIYLAHQFLLYSFFQKKITKIQKNLSYKALLLSDVVEIQNLDQKRFPRSKLDSAKLSARHNFIQELQAELTMAPFDGLLLEYQELVKEHNSLVASYNSVRWPHKRQFQALG